MAPRSATGWIRSSSFAAVSGALVLAEGLETEAEQETVQRLGVVLGQGFRLARPARIEAWTLPVMAAPTADSAKVIPIRKRQAGA